MFFRPIVLVSTLVTLLLLPCLAQEDIDTSTPCESTYDKCLDKCDQQDNPTAECIIGCEKNYDSCLEKSESQPED